MSLITDPEEVWRLAREKGDENWAFRAWIKAEFGFDDPRLMPVVIRLAEEITAQIDCTACGNCCRQLGTALQPGDAPRLAQALGIDVATLTRTYLTADEMGEGQVLPPCPWLEGNRCTVYDARPSTCREYPSLHNDIRASSLQRLGDASLCPVVYNLFEALKVELGWPGLSEMDRL